jgi:hypothetical protein
MPKALEHAHGDQPASRWGRAPRRLARERDGVRAGEVKRRLALVESGRRVARTEVGVVKGNVTYMALAARGLDVDARADLYSLALVMFMFATGKPLYARRRPTVLMKAGAGPASGIVCYPRAPNCSPPSSIAPPRRASRTATRMRDGRRPGRGRA